MESTGIGKVRAERLWDLAIVFGHGWAQYFAESFRQSEQPWTQGLWTALKAQGRAAFVARAQRAGWVEDVMDRAGNAGEDAPTAWIGLVGWERHTTGSGTISWEIAQDGTVTLTGRVRTAPGRKNRRIAQVTLRPGGAPRVEVFGDFPALSQGDAADFAPNWDNIDQPAQYDYTWAKLTQAVRCLGYTLPPRPVDRPAPRLPRTRAGLAAAA